MAVIGAHDSETGSKQSNGDATVLLDLPPDSKPLLGGNGATDADAGTPPAKQPLHGSGGSASLPPSLLTRLVACLQYGCMSVAITLFNRAVFSVYHFNYPSTVTLLQILVSLLLMYALRAAGFMQFGALDVHTARKARVWH